MSNSLVGIVGIVLTLALGIPGVVWLFAGLTPALQALVCTAIAVAIGAVLATIWFWRIPAWTIVRSVSELDVHDAEGRSARYVKHLRLRANRRGLQNFVHRNLSHDGTAVFSVEGTGELTSEQVVAGDRHVQVTFPNQLGLFEEVDTALVADCTDAFMQNPDGVIVLVDQLFKEIVVRIRLPKGQYRDGKILYSNAGVEKTIGKPAPEGAFMVWRNRRLLGRKIRPGEYSFLYYKN